MANKWKFYIFIQKIKRGKMSGNLFIYDSSFEGMLTAFYTALEMENSAAEFLKDSTCLDELFILDAAKIASSSQKTESLLEQIKSSKTPKLSYLIFKIWLSEIPLENQLYQLLFRAISSDKNILEQLNDKNVSVIVNTASKVSREIHRYKGILRFSQTKNNFYIGLFEPEYNIILPLANHFKTRLRGEKWVIIDKKRNIAAIYSDGNIRTAEQIELEELKNAKFAEDEILIRELWQKFFRSVAIPERNNKKLQSQCLPKKYWKYLTEFNCS